MVNVSKVVPQTTHVLMAGIPTIYGKIGDGLLLLYKQIKHIRTFVWLIQCIFCHFYQISSLTSKFMEVRLRSHIFTEQYGTYS